MLPELRVGAALVVVAEQEGADLAVGEQRAGHEALVEVPLPQPGGLAVVAPQVVEAVQVQGEL
jgi:hypothetical protein